MSGSPLRDLAQALDAGQRWVGHQAVDSSRTGPVPWHSARHGGQQVLLGGIGLAQSAEGNCLHLCSTEGCASGHPACNAPEPFLGADRVLPVPHDCSRPRRAFPGYIRCKVLSGVQFSQRLIQAACSCQGNSLVLVGAGVAGV